MKNCIKTRIIPLFGAIVFIVAIGFSMTTCSYADEYKEVYFSLQKTGADSFTITVDGAKWRYTHSGGVDVADTVKDFMIDYSKAYYNNGQTDRFMFEGTRTSDTVITITLGSSYSNLQGTISRGYENFYSSAQACTDGGSSVEYNGFTHYNWSTSSITFP